MSSRILYEYTNMKKLGFYLDGWADIVEGKGKKAKKVSEDVMAQLQAREMPQIKVGEKTGFVSTMSTIRRQYVSTETYPGVTTMIYIREHGKDLYASWRTFIRPVLNTIVLWIIGGISLFLGVLSSSTSRNPGEAFIGGLIGGVILISFLMALAGHYIKGDLLAFFLIEPNYFDVDDIIAMSVSVHYSVQRALDKAGIDTAKLRLKRDFKGSRKGNIV
jgi:hypothetical protein